MLTKKRHTQQKIDRELRLKKLAEREIDPADLAQANGGSTGIPKASRYCSFVVY